VPDVTALAAQPAASPRESADAARISRLEEEVATLTSAVHALEQRLERLET
jgi:ubiquinone biosynthesis protein UbiJ